jgi:DNA-binding PadR family transcriptional regulator
VASRTNQTETAVLGALSVQPMTGYALREAIRDVLGHFWNESFGQIYPTLADLERQDLVERQDSPRPQSSTFAITSQGRVRLKELLAQPIQPLPPRNGLMLRLFFGRHLGRDACRSLVLDARTDAQRRLAQYAEIRQGIETDDDHADDRTFWLLTVSAGEHTARAAVEWADEALAVFDEMDAPLDAPKQRRN